MERGGSPKFLSKHISLNGSCMYFRYVEAEGMYLRDEHNCWEKSDNTVNIIEGKEGMHRYFEYIVRWNISLFIKMDLFIVCILNKNKFSFFIVP